jgi:hypothetical protein
MLTMALIVVVMFATVDPVVTAVGTVIAGAALALALH